MSLESFRNSLKGIVPSSLDQVTDPQFQKNLIMSVAIPAGLFFILSPGLLLSVFPNSKGKCSKAVPLPTSADGECLDNGKYSRAGGVTAPSPATDYDHICKKQKECRQLFVSGYTGLNSIIVHSFVFVIIMAVVSYYYRNM